MTQTRLSVKVIPSSSKDCIVGWLVDSLKVKVQAPPEKGKANRSVTKILAKALGINPKNISIVSAEISANKLLIVNGMNKEDILIKIPDKEII